MTVRTKFSTIANTTNTIEWAKEVSTFFETHNVITFQVVQETDEQYEKIHIQYEA